MRQNLGNINWFIDRCWQVYDIELLEILKRFLKHVRGCKYIKNVKNYPDNRSFDGKPRYLYHLILGPHFVRHAMWSKINQDSSLQWPKGDDGRISPNVSWHKRNNNVDVGCRCWREMVLQVQHKRSVWLCASLQIITDDLIIFLVT